MMKLILLAVMAVLATAAHAQQKTQNFYDSRGNVAGTARTATTFIDKRGRFVGTAINRGKGMALHDRHGNFTRSVVRPLPQRVRPAPLSRPFTPPAMPAR